MSDTGVIPVHGDGTAWLEAHASAQAVAWLRDQAGAVADTARREADLAILGEHAMVLASPEYTDWGVKRDDYRVVNEHPSEGDLRGVRPGLCELHCRSCRRAFPCRTVVLLAGAYQYRDGWAKHWEGL